MKLDELCKAVYPSCKRIRSQTEFMDKLFVAAGGKAFISDPYKKSFFNGNKPFTVNQKTQFRGKDNLASLTSFFENEIDDAGKALMALSIPEKETPDIKALAVALAHQMKLLIDSDVEDVENILVLQYQQAKQTGKEQSSSFAKPLYKGDSVSVYQVPTHVIQSFDKVVHTWELINTGSIPWKNRRLFYRRGPKDRPEANPETINIPDVQPGKSIKISTTIDGRGFDGVTRCIWEMQDDDGENCFPDRDTLFCVTIDAKFKRK